MTKRLAIMVHGVGTSHNNRPGWSDLISKYLRGHGIKTTECLWNDITEHDSTTAFTRRFKKPKWFQLRKLITYYFRKFMFDFAVDATAYNKYNNKISDQLYKCYKAHEADYDVIYLIGYSLGGWITYDTLDRHNQDMPKCKGMITFGSSIPLNRLDYFTGFSNILWTNIWSEYDVLSMPFKMPHIEDRHFRGKVPVLSNTPASHLQYTKTRAFALYLVKELATMIRYE